MMVKGDTPHQPMRPKRTEKIQHHQYFWKPKAGVVIETSRGHWYIHWECGKPRSKLFGAEITHCVAIHKTEHFPKEKASRTWEKAVSLAFLPDPLSLPIHLTNSTFSYPSRRLKVSPLEEVEHRSCKLCDSKLITSGGTWADNRGLNSLYIKQWDSHPQSFTWL